MKPDLLAVFIVPSWKGREDSPRWGARDTAKNPVLRDRGQRGMGQLTAFFVDIAVVFGTIVGLLAALIALEPGPPEQTRSEGRQR